MSLNPRNKQGINQVPGRGLESENLLVQTPREKCEVRHPQAVLERGVPLNHHL